MATCPAELHGAPAPSRRYDAGCCCCCCRASSDLSRWLKSSAMLSSSQSCEGRAEVGWSNRRVAQRDVAAAASRSGEVLQ